jgi:2',3'-cyclic-nucleotide 2'-phosphodiesterase (5'-nucleotidase family)
MMKRIFQWSMMTIGVAVVAAAIAGAETVGATAADISGAGSRARETTGGNFVADALKASVRADAAVVAADALTTASLPKGDLSRADLKSLLEDPDDTVAILVLTGTQLRTVLERSVSAYPKPFDGFLQVAGLTVQFNAAKAGSPRITTLNVNGLPIKPDATYRVATLSTLAHGGLGYFRMWEDGDIAGSGPSALDAVVNYVRQEKTVSPRVEGRIVAR